MKYICQQKAMSTSKAVFLLLSVILSWHQADAGESGANLFFKGLGRVGRKLHSARSPQSFRARVGAAVLSKVSNCPGIKPSDVAKLVAQTKVKARIGAIPRAPTPEAARFAGQTITMYIAPKALTAKRQQEVLGPIARGLSKLGYCPFEGDYVLKLEATLLTVEVLDKKRQLTATDKKIIKCLTKIKVTLRAGHIEKINTAAATKAGTLVVPYIVAA